MVHLTKTTLLASAALALCGAAHAIALPEESNLPQPTEGSSPPQPPVKLPISIISSPTTSPLPSSSPIKSINGDKSSESADESDDKIETSRNNTKRPEFRPVFKIVKDDSGDEDDKDDKKKMEERERERGRGARKLEESFNVGKKQLVINSRPPVLVSNGTANGTLTNGTLTNGTVFNRFQYVFGVRGMPHIRASYFEKNEDDDSKVRSTWLLGLIGIAEVSPTINITQTDSFIPFLGQSSKWSRMQITDEPIDNTTSIKTASITYNDGGFSCTINATFSPVNATGIADGMQNVKFRPNAVKYSLELNNYPYKYNDSDLVIVKFFYSSSTVKLSGGTRNRTISLADNTGFYNWVSNATTETGTFVSIEPFGDSLLPEDIPLGSGSSRRRLPDLPKEVKEELLDLKSPSNRTQEKGAIALFKTNFAAANVSRPRMLVWDPEVGVSTSAGTDSSNQPGGGQRPTSAGVAIRVSGIVSLVIAAVSAMAIL